MEGNGPVVIKALLMFEDGDVSPEDVELSGASVLLEGIGWEDEED